MLRPASAELVEAVVARRDNIRPRLAIGAGVALAAGALVGWRFTAVWLAVWVAVQIAEYAAASRLARRVRAGRPARAAPSLLLMFVANLAFGAMALAAVLTGDVWTMMCGVFILTGALLNACATSAASRSAFMASAAPAALYCGMLPALAAAAGAAPAQLWGLTVGAALLMVSSLVLRSVGLRALLQAKQASAAKSTFLANMSHEIRTPMNGVLGMAQAMAADELPQVQRERLMVIQRSGQALLALLNDLLDLSKIEAGKLELEEGVVDFEGLCRDLEASFRTLCAAKDICLGVGVEPSAAGLWRGDPTRVRQVLANLLANAVKFTDRGVVEATVAHAGGFVVVEVRDTGPGIAPERLSSLFDKFVQADATTTRRYGGTGLGLAICRELSELMGGDIAVESEVGRGATFRVRLALTRAERETAPVAEAAAPDLGGGLRVLAAEDHEMNQAVLRVLLQQAGVEAHIVGNGREALEAMEAEPWDVVLMDIQMPVMDGPTAVRLIRAREAALGLPRTPIIALTANAMAHHIDEYLASGMDGVVAKPVEFLRLLEAIAAVLEPAGAGGATGSPSAVA